MDKSESYSVAIIPPKHIIEKAIVISKKLLQLGSLFKLDDDHFPHISIYQSQYPIKNLNKIIESLKKQAQILKKTKLNSLSYRQIDNGFIDVVYERRSDLEDLQFKIIKSLSPLREGLKNNDDLNNINIYNKTQQQNINLYGYRSIGSMYFPHLTFTKYKEIQDESILLKIPSEDFSFVANKIGLFYQGDYGTCRKLIYLSLLQL